MSDHLVACPICKKEVIAMELFEAHLSYCRKKFCSNGPMYECAYNTMHVVPLREKAYHLMNCPDKDSLPINAQLASLRLAHVGGINNVNNSLDNQPCCSKSLVEKPVSVATFNAIPPLPSSMKRLGE